MHCGHCETNSAARAMVSGVAIFASHFKIVGDTDASNEHEKEEDDAKEPAIYIRRNNLREGLLGIYPVTNE